MIKLHDLEFIPFISEEKIMEAISKMAEEIAEEYKNTTPVFLGVLNGSFLVASEIIKRYKGPCEVQFVKLESYQGTSTTGSVNTLIGLPSHIKGKEVVVIEDIVDTGNTLEVLDKLLTEREVAGYKVASLFYKPAAYKKNIKIDFVGMEIPNDFIVGFGLDYNGLGRNLTQVYKLKEN